MRSVRVAERLALPNLDHGVAGSNPAGGEILPKPKRRFIAQSLSCSPFHCLEMTEILLKGCKALTHPCPWTQWILSSLPWLSGLCPGLVSMDNVQTVHWVPGECPLSPWTISTESMDIVQSGWSHGTLSMDSLDFVQSIHGLCPDCPVNPW